MSKALQKFDDLFDLNKEYHLHPAEADLLKDYLLKKKGWIYIATSPSLDLAGLSRALKIGRTAKSPMGRAKSLSTTGVPYEYTPIFSLEFLNTYIAETKISQKLKKFRGEKEFYHINVNMAIDCIEEEYERQKKALNRYFSFQDVLTDPQTLSFYLR